MVWSAEDDDNDDDDDDDDDDADDEYDEDTYRCTELHSFIKCHSRP